ILYCIIILIFYYKHLFFFFQAEDGIRDRNVTGVQTCALPISTSICNNCIMMDAVMYGIIPIAKMEKFCKAPPPNVFKKPNTFSRSEEHTSELQSRFDLVCRLLLEKKKKITK